jgi:hypothetical protein
MEFQNSYVLDISNQSDLNFPLFYFIDHKPTFLSTLSVCYQYTTVYVNTRLPKAKDTTITDHFVVYNWSLAEGNIII